MYTAILFAVDPGGGDTLSLSRQVNEKESKENILQYLQKEAQLPNRDAMDTVLIMKNGKSAPEVVYHWTGANGDIG